MFFRSLKNYFVASIASALTMSTVPVSAEYELNLRQGVTTISQGAYDANIIILMFVGITIIVVVGIMFWSIFRHRKSTDAPAKQFHKSVAAELIWAIIPILILVATAAPAIKSLILMKNNAGSGATKQSTGYQWRNIDVTDALPQLTFRGKSQNINSSLYLEKKAEPHQNVCFSSENLGVERQS